MANNDNHEENLIDKFAGLFQSNPNTVDELDSIIKDSATNNVITKDTCDMIEGIFELSNLRVRDIMVPKSSMISIANDNSLEDVIKIVIESGHSRYPVLSEDREQVIGLLLSKDLIKLNNDHVSDWKSIIRPAMIIPEGKKLNYLLKDFQKKYYHLAVVVDEFNSVSGVVTIEDILEIIVGKIGDEYDDSKDSCDIKEVGKNLYLVNGMTAIFDFNEFFGVDVDNKEVETIAGIVISQLGHLPKIGEQVKLQKFEFKVLSLEHRRIGTLQVKVDENLITNSKNEKDE